MFLFIVFLERHGCVELERTFLAFERLVGGNHLVVSLHEVLLQDGKMAEALPAQET